MILKPLYTPSVATSRILELDALRGLAALSVVGYHYTTRYNDIYGHTSDFFYQLPAGRYGVLLFFMISGFVILMSLQRTQRSLDFIVGRLARLYPTYWVAIALTFSAVALIGLPGREVSLKNALLNSLMIHRFWRIPDVDGVYWTLHVEFIFYVLMLSLFILRLLPHIEKVLFIWLSLNALENHHLLINIPERLESWFLPEYAHLFIMGIVFYRIRQQGPSFFRYGLLAGGLASQLALYPEWDKHLAIVFYMVIFFLINAGKLWAIAIPPLMALGTISYPLYLVHQNIGYIVIRDLEMRGLSPIFSIVAAFSVSIALAAVITRFVEQPSLRWIKSAYRKRFPPQVRQAGSS